MKKILFVLIVMLGVSYAESLDKKLYESVVKNKFDTTI